MMADPDSNPLTVKNGPYIMGMNAIQFERNDARLLVGGAKKVQKTLARQDAALKGAEGGVLLAVSAIAGTTIARIRLDALPTWDGMAAARGRLYLSPIAGRVLCLGPAAPPRPGPAPDR